jgi:hypothetical protein
MHQKNDLPDISDARAAVLATVEMPAGMKFGPAMNALTVKHRAFVLAWFALGSRNPVDAARMVYPDNDTGAIRVQAHRLMHRDDIQAAMQEEAKRRVKAYVPMALRNLADIADNPQHKHQLQAITTVLNRGGLHEVSESKHTVEVVLTRAEKLAEIREFARVLNIDPEALLGRVVDMPAIDVTPEPDEAEPSVADPFAHIEY